jgi:gamma-glutamyltranspeptidase
LVAATAALVGVVSAAACGSGGGGVPVINLYYAPEQNFQEFASAEWILEWTGDHQQQAEDGTLEVPLESARYEDRLYAAPKNTTR